MRKLFLSLALIAGIASVGAQTAITPHSLEVTTEKTTHILFPSAVVYVDLGSTDIIADKADGAENVLRVKAATQGFEAETNMAVITADGSFYSFDVRFSDAPTTLNIEMSRPKNAPEMRLTSLAGESPAGVDLITRAIHSRNKRHIRGVGSHRFGVGFTLRGIYVNDGLIYLHTQLSNDGNVPLDVDFVRFKIMDKRLARRTAIQETVIRPVRVFNDVTRVGGRRTERSIFVLEKITIPDDKLLIVELFERGGGRHQRLIIDNADLVGARLVNDLKTQK